MPQLASGFTGRVNESILLTWLRGEVQKSTSKSHQSVCAAMFPKQTPFQHQNHNLEESHTSTMRCRHH